MDAMKKALENKKMRDAINIQVSVDDSGKPVVEVDGQEAKPAMEIEVESEEKPEEEMSEEGVDKMMTEEVSPEELASMKSGRKLGIQERSKLEALKRLGKA